MRWKVGYAILNASGTVEKTMHVDGTIDQAVETLIEETRDLLRTDPEVVSLVIWREGR